MSTLRLRPALVLLALAALGGAGCSPTSIAEERVEAALQEAIGPADRYDVSFEGLDAGDGTADRVTIVGERVRPAQAPALDRLDAVLEGVRFDRGESRLERAERVRADVRVRPSDLAAYVEASGRVREATAEVRAPDVLVLRLQPDIAGLPLPSGAAVEVTGTLRGDGPRLRFDVAEVRAAGLGLGGRVADVVSAEVNPLFDLSDVGGVDLGGVEVSGARVEDGVLVVTAGGSLAGVSFE